MDIDLSPTLTRFEGLVSSIFAALPNVVVAMLVFAFFFLFGVAARRSVRIAVRRYGRRRNLGIVLGRLSLWVSMFIGMLVALSIVLPTFNPGDAIQILGIGSIAIGFAFRDILQNFLAGILLLVTEPFRIGDQIVFNGYEGTVEDIHTRATTIRTYDGRRVVIPNADLFTQSVTVNTAFDQRRSEYDIGIGYGDDIERARALIVRAVAGVPGVLPEPAPDAIVVDLAPSSVKIRARWWTESRWSDVLLVRDRVLDMIKATLNESGIDLPFPTHQILLHDQTEETDGDRTRQREGWPAGAGPAPRAQSAVLREVEDQARPAGGRNRR